MQTPEMGPRPSGRKILLGIGIVLALAALVAWGYSCAQQDRVKRAQQKIEKDMR